MTERQRLRWRSWARTDAGTSRETNQDAFLNRPEVGLWVVADGMGGHAGGGLASTATVESLAKLAVSNQLSKSITQVEDCLLRTNTYLREQAIARNIHTIGSTVVALRFAGRHGVCIWAGDSRAYRYRRGCLERITQDHTLVGELLERGIIDADQVDGHPHSNLLTRAIGAADELHPDLEIFDLEPRDVYVLCSDGLDKEVTEDDIGLTLERDSGEDPSDALVNLALANGGRDNITVIAIAVDCAQLARANDARPG